MKKRKLEADFEYNFSLYGMISALKEYKLAWLLNRQLNIELDKVRDIEIDFLRSQNLIISNYLYETEHSCFRLLKNKSINQYDENLAFLVPELKRFDYLVTIQGFEDTFSKRGLKDNLSSIPGVQYVQHFSIDELKSKENLIF